MGKWSDVTTLIPQINQSLGRSPVSISGIYAQLNFARSLACLKEIADNNNLPCVSRVRRDNLKQLLARQKPDIKTPDWKQIAQAIEVVIQQAPEETYILVYDSDASQGSLLKARDWDKLLRQTGEQKSIELLVLSACETAEGDERA